MNDSTPPRSWPIGKLYPGATVRIAPEHSAAYAHATGDLNPAYQGVDAIAPPMFHVRLTRDVLFAVATDPELGLDMARLVHGEHAATFLAPLRPGDTVRTEAELLQVEEKPTGLVVVSRMSVLREDLPVVDCRTVFFIRAPAPAERKPERPRAPAPEPPPPDYDSPIQVPQDASFVYAEASLDRNPIHLDRAFAQAAGLPDVILHGLCTMAFTAREAVRFAGGQDPRRLQHIAVRFARPVLNGQTLRALGWRQPNGDWALETLGPDGKPVITQGLARFKS